ncbi:hypothetical protein [Alicyclobacillus fodiniaquatilis]|uniref:Uncharacterized protein n=1 Tax=Alicyclobacillus fodiniaquatilis TaxID=1661150 RepID=A0ABW4JGQ9_9BACL
MQATEERERVTKKRRVFADERMKDAEWIAVMQGLIEHLYNIRVATTEQLFQMIPEDSKANWLIKKHTQKWNLRRKIEQFSNIRKSRMKLNLYSPDKDVWYDAPNCIVNTLDRTTVLEYENKVGYDYYLANDKAESSPNRDQRNRYVLLTELYIQMAKCGMEYLMQWIPNVAFKRLFDQIKYRNEEPHDPGLLGGLIYKKDNDELQLVGLSVFTSTSRVYKKYMEWVIAKGNEGLYEPVVFVQKSFQKEAMQKCLHDHHNNAWIMSYEWAVKNPVSLIDAIRFMGRRTILQILEPYRINGGHIEEVAGVAPTFRWKVTKQDGKEVYIDTTLGRPIGTIVKLAIEISSLGGPEHIVWCTTKEEKEFWESVSKEASTDIKYYVMDETILSNVRLPLD